MNAVQDAMTVMWDKAKDRLTRPELLNLACATEHATDEARRLSTVVDGIASLVREDELNPSGVGSFQEPRSLLDLLEHVAHGLDGIAALIQLGDRAGNHVEKMEEDERQGRTEEAQEGFARLSRQFDAIEKSAGRKSEVLHLAAEGREEASSLESVMDGRAGA